jgi:branched-chain amino acid transport system ATP-binding protein
MAEPLLQARDIAHRFGGVLANRGISLSLEPAEVRGLIGPNGAGKTTFLNVVSGIYAPGSGTVTFAGVEITGRSPMEIARLGLLRTFQIPRVFRGMTVRENLLTPTFARRSWRDRQGAKRDEARVRELLDLTKLTEHETDPAGSLSGGEQALLQVAVGFMAENLRCYVMDEPFAGITPVLKERIFDLIRHENESRGISFLIVSHEMTAIRLLCSRVTVLVDGQVLREGTMDEIVADPRVIAAYLEGTAA